MLQIRLSKGGSALDGGATAAKPPAAAETVTVACPDHLVLADLPVAKSLGAITASSRPSLVKSIGRRSRRHLGERVHFCVCCDHPIAVYGRLMPCEHAFCLTCARSDSSCYLCDERIQKIQTIKMMEGIFICAAPHCLKSFLKKSEFEAHVHEAHADLLQVNAERDGVNAPRTCFSPTSNTQPPEARRNLSREQTPLRPPKQPQTSDPHPDAPGNPPYNWFHLPLHRQDSDQNLLLHNYPVPVLLPQPPLFSYPLDGGGGGGGQASLLGFPPAAPAPAMAWAAAAGYGSGDGGAAKEADMAGGAVPPQFRWAKFPGGGDGAQDGHAFGWHRDNRSSS
ncbi:RING/U-box superfamily protein [Wolffia australiana]